MTDNPDMNRDEGHCIAISPTGVFYEPNQVGHGMLLRDWFAGQSLPGAIEDYDGPATPYSAQATGTREEIIARQAYKYADAMLKARDEK